TLHPTPYPLHPDAAPPPAATSRPPPRRSATPSALDRAAPRTVPPAVSPALPPARPARPASPRSPSLSRGGSGLVRLHTPLPAVPGPGSPASGRQTGRRAGSGDRWPRPPVSDPATPAPAAAPR